MGEKWVCIKEKEVDELIQAGARQAVDGTFRWSQAVINMKKEPCPSPESMQQLIEAAKAADKVLDFGGLYGEEWAMWLARLTKVACSVRKALREIEEASNE